MFDLAPMRSDFSGTTDRFSCTADWSPESRGRDSRRRRGNAGPGRPENWRMPSKCGAAGDEAFERLISNATAARSQLYECMRRCSSARELRRVPTGFPEEGPTPSASAMPLRPPRGPRPRSANA
jgi:hypothetical protein